MNLRRTATRSVALVAAIALVASTAQAAQADALAWTPADAVFGGEDYLPAARASAPPTIDGDLSDWESAVVASIPVRDGQVELAGWAGDADLSAAVRAQHDDANLYLAFEIVDDVHSAQSGSTMWRGDSVQFAFSPGSAYGPEYTAAVVDGVAELIRGTVGGAIADAGLVEIAGSTTGNTTIIEIAMPWATITSAVPASGSLPFTFLVNDNDGTGRRGWVEWTPGIGKAKAPSLHGEIDLLPAGREWGGWLKGPTTAATGDTVEYVLTAVNEATEDRTLTVSSAALSVDESIVVPASSSITATVSKSFTQTGSNVIAVQWSDAAGNVRRDSINLQVADAETDVRGKLEAAADSMPAIDVLLAQADGLGISTDYERARRTVIERFVGYGYNDLDNGRAARASYVADTLTSLVEETTTTLQQYIAGTAQPLAVPRYRTGTLGVDGRSITGSVEDPETGEVSTQPIFLTGFGHFEQVRADVPVFEDFGFNAIQIEVGPRDVVLPATSALEGFTVNRSGGVDATVERDTSRAHSGTASLKIQQRTPYGANVFVNAVQSLAVKPNTQYAFEVWVKGENVRNAWFPGGAGWAQRVRFPNGTYDWTKVSTTYTTGPNETTYALTLLSENTGTVWVDGLTVTEAGGATNLVKNGDFEVAVIAGSDPAWVLSTTKLKSSVVDVLDNAAANNVAVNLLISPHYFPSWALTKWPELATTNNGSIKYSIDHPIARSMIEDYVRTLIRTVKDAPALQSITLTNEPVYQANQDPNARPDWAAFLSDTYGADIAALNAAYSSTYASFAEVAMPTSVRADLKSYDYVQFNNDRFAAWHEWLAGLVAEEAPGLPVHAKMMADTTGSLSWGVDVERLSRLGSVIGNDNWNYIDEGPSGFFEELSFYDLQRSLAEGPIFNSEQHLIADGDQYYGADQADHVRSVLWQSAIHGRSASTMWIWERTYDPSSSREGSILHRPDVIVAAADTNLDLNRLAGEVTAFQEVEPRVRILSSPSSALLASESVGVSERAYEAISASGIDVGFVSEGQLASGEVADASIVVIPASSRVRSSTLEWLDEFLADGGRVVMIGTHALEYTAQGQEHPDALRDSIRARSLYIPAAETTAASLSAQLQPLFDEELEDRIVLRDSSGQLPANVEWRTAEVDGGVLLNVVNYGDSPLTLTASRGASPLEVSRDVLAGVTGGASSLTVEPLVPRLVELAVPAPDTQRPDVTLVQPEGIGPYSRLDIRVDASDDRGLDRIVANIYRDGKLYKSTQSRVNGTAATHLATKELPDATYEVRYNAHDAAGNVSRTGKTTVVIDATPPRITIKSGEEFTTTAGDGYSRVSFKLYDAGKVTRVVVNGVEKDLADSPWSDVNFVRPGIFGAVAGANSLVAYDLAGNSTQLEFTLQ